MVITAACPLWYVATMTSVAISFHGFVSKIPVQYWYSDELEPEQGKRTKWKLTLAHVKKNCWYHCTTADTAQPQRKVATHGTPRKEIGKKWIAGFRYGWKKMEEALQDRDGRRQALHWEWQSINQVNKKQFFSKSLHTDAQINVLYPLWWSGIVVSTLASINEVNLRWAQLVYWDEQLCPVQFSVQFPV